MSNKKRAIEEIIEYGYPQCLIQRKGEPTSELIMWDKLMMELFEAWYATASVNEDIIRKAYESSLERFPVYTEEQANANHNIRMEHAYAFEMGAKWFQSLKGAEPEVSEKPVWNYVLSQIDRLRKAHGRIKKVNDVGRLKIQFEDKTWYTLTIDRNFNEATLDTTKITEEEIDQILKDNLIQGTYGIITSRAAKAILKLLR